jgi:hypothetical protein
MTTYALVAGAWLGGWAWRPVTRRLRDQGHEVHPVTLTGLGDRPQALSVCSRLPGSWPRCSAA